MVWCEWCQLAELAELAEIAELADLERCRRKTPNHVTTSGWSGGNNQLSRSGKGNRQFWMTLAVST